DSKRKTSLSPAQENLHLLRFRWATRHSATARALQDPAPVAVSLLRRPALACARARTRVPSPHGIQHAHEHLLMFRWATPHSATSLSLYVTAPVARFLPPAPAPARFRARSERKTAHSPAQGHLHLLRFRWATRHSATARALQDPAPVAVARRARA